MAASASRQRRKRQAASISVMVASYGGIIIISMKISSRVAAWRQRNHQRSININNK